MTYLEFFYACINYSEDHGHTIHIGDIDWMWHEYQHERGKYNYLFEYKYNG